MKIATTTADFERYTYSDADRIRELHRAGFKCIDLSLYNIEEVNRVYNDNDFHREVEKLKSLAEELCVSYAQAHLPGGNPLQKDAEWEDFLRATLRSIEICGMLGIKNAVIHAGWKSGIEKAEWQRENREFIDLLLPTLEKWGVNLLIENSTRANMGDRYYVNSGRELLDFIEFVNHPQVHACWDTGHANCEGSQYEDILTLGEHLYAIHYNDNRGKSDEHLAPYMGTLNHDEVMCALIDAKYKGYFTLECCSPLTPAKYWHGDRRVFERETRLLEPKLPMQRKIEELLYETAKHILSEYGMCEE